MNLSSFRFAPLPAVCTATLLLALPLACGGSGDGDQPDSGATGGLTGSGGTAGSGGSASGGAASGGSGGATASGPWKNVVIGGGGYVTGLRQHPSDTSLLYARTDIGGAYRFEPTAKRWTAITDFLTRDNSDSMGVLGIALDPSDSDRVYLLTGKYTQSWAGAGAVLVSTDRGETFSRTAITPKIGGNENGRGAGERLVVDPNDGAILYLGTTADGLWRSADHGASFTKVNSFSPTNVNFVSVQAGSGDIYVAVATAGASLWKSVDDGVSFDLVPAQPAGVMALRYTPAGDDLLVSFANAVGPMDATTGSVQLLDTADDSFDDISPPINNYGFSGVSVDPGDLQHMVASTLDRWSPHDEIFQTFDGGTSWEPVLETASFGFAKSPYAEAGNPHWTTDVSLNPADTSQAWFVTGYGLFLCSDMDTAAAHCEFESDGIEELVAIELISPSQGAPLLSAVGDLDGFRHVDLDASPAAGRYAPNYGTTLGIDFAELDPAVIVKQHNSAPFGSYSEDGGVVWTPFATQPAGTTAGGTRSIAIAADGSNIVWSPRGAAGAAMGLYYSQNQGDSWTLATGGAPLGLIPVADRVNSSKFYAFDGLTGAAYVSTTGGASFAAGANGLPTLADWEQIQVELAAVPTNEGHLWLTLGAHGLYLSTNSGANFTPVSGVDAAYRVGFGKEATAGAEPAVYLWGTVGGALGIYRSDDYGTSWVRINDDNHQFGWLHSVIGDPRIHGRVYVGTEGRGIQYRDLAD